MQSGGPFWWFPALQWFLGLHVLALLFWPWVRKAFSGLADRGASLAIPGGVFTFILLMQVVWRFGLGEPHPVWFWGWAVGFGLLGWRFFPPQPTCPATRKHMIRTAWQGALVFASAFLAWTFIRAADPAANHTEQPMDVMWMRAAMVSSAPPIQDAWFSGEPATYYVEGHQMLGFLANLHGTPIQVAVNLGQITWFALTLSLVYAAAAQLAAPGLRERPRSTAGVFAVLFLLGSNPVGAFHALGFEVSGDWWWWDATRVLYDGDIAMIAEFPFFSFWLGDNHAHLLGIPILLLSVVAAMQLYRCPKADFFTGFMLVLSLVWGWRTNAWQAPTALALPMAALLARWRPQGGFDFPRFHPSIFVGLLLPCLLLFPSGEGGMFQGVVLNDHGIRNPIELFRVFGFFLPGLLCLFFVKKRSTLWLWVLLLSLGMLATCELVYVRDIFGSRMNTVFKVYYQVWILFALLAATGVAHILRARRPLCWLALPCMVYLLAAWIYPVRLVVPAFFGTPKSLNAFSVVSETRRAFLLKADAHIRPGDRIAEAPGRSYHEHTSLLGTWTAGNTIIGWEGHQHQWRPGVVHPEVIHLYTAATEKKLQEELDRLDVQWVLAGPLEQQWYAIEPEWHQWMRRRFDLVFEEQGYFLYGNPR
ncbi:MAG: DUF2298 domain-containing protein [Kiritimatiellae bacterium]|nr:DUF2298 domain-containing protein [Kiritimatiellia bacterium]